MGLSQQSGEEEKRVAVWCTKQCRHGFGLRKTNKQNKTIKWEDNGNIMVLILDNKLPLPRVEGSKKQK